MPRIKKKNEPDMRPFNPDLPVSEDNPIVPWTRRQRRWDRRNKDPAKWKYKDVPAHPVKLPEAAWNRGLKGHPHNPATQIHLGNHNGPAGDNHTYKRYKMEQRPTVEEIAGKMMNRALSNQIRKASEELINANKEQWLKELHLAAQVVLDKAIQERDQNALMAVWDRIVGKPTTQVDMSVKQDETIDDIALMLRNMNPQIKENESGTKASIQQLEHRGSEFGDSTGSGSGDIITNTTNTTIRSEQSIQPSITDKNAEKND